MEKRRIILCEGETDQVLLGYYLMGTSGWKYNGNKANLPFPNESINWFRNVEEQELGIWAVGGNDFSTELEEILQSEMMEHSIERIVIVTDHDDETAEIERSFALRDVVRKTLRLKENLDDIWANNVWMDIAYNNSFGEEHIGVCYLLVPIEKEGALETFMLDALYEREDEKKNVIDQVRAFLHDFSSKKYLKKRREKVKAELGVSMSIMSPDRVFKTMNELLESVSWDKFDATNEQFGILREI